MLVTAAQLRNSHESPASLMSGLVRWNGWESDKLEPVRHQNLRTKPPTYTLYAELNRWCALEKLRMQQKQWPVLNCCISWVIKCIVCGVTALVTALVPVLLNPVPGNDTCFHKEWWNLLIFMAKIQVAFTAKSLWLQQLKVCWFFLLLLHEAFHSEVVLPCWMMASADFTVSFWFSLDIIPQTLSDSALYWIVSVEGF